MRRAVSACLLLTFSALPVTAGPVCRYDRDGEPVGRSRLRAACDPGRAVHGRDIVRGEAPSGPRPWALPRGRDSLPMPGPF